MFFPWSPSGTCLIEPNLMGRLGEVENVTKFGYKNARITLTYESTARAIER